MPDSLFIDPDHLNWNGARRFTEALRAEIGPMLEEPAAPFRHAAGEDPRRPR
jgi:hypothetical protein